MTHKTPSTTSIVIACCLVAIALMLAVLTWTTLDDRASRMAAMERVRQTLTDSGYGNP